MTRVGIVTGARSDYGILRPVIRALEDASDLAPVLLVTGSHLAPAYGNTIAEVEADGFDIGARIDMLLAGDSAAAIAKSVGIGTMGFAQSLSDMQLDVLLVLGDRYETFAAVVAAVILGIPVAHVHGGEVTEGAVDEQIRHAITKLSHLHFPATQEYAQRIAQMGEEPWRITVSGAPALDNLHGLEIPPRSKLEDLVGGKLADPLLAVTYHPETLAADGGLAGAQAMLDALSDQRGSIVITYPNADTGGSAVLSAINEFARDRAGTFLVTSLGTRLYFTLLREAAAMVGNSSSGLLEAPSFKLPVVNIGERQTGRLRAANVIDAPADATSIRAALARALSPEFRASLESLQNPYGDGKAAQRIVERLRKLEPRSVLLSKKFHDMPQGDRA